MRNVSHVYTSVDIHFDHMISCWPKNQIVKLISLIALQRDKTQMLYTATISSCITFSLFLFWFTITVIININACKCHCTFVAPLLSLIRWLIMSYHTTIFTTKYFSVISKQTSNTENQGCLMACTVWRNLTCELNCLANVTSELW